MDTRQWGASLFVATSGFVWFAKSVTYDGTFYHLNQAQIVRRWGTDTGLNQLVNGPTKETVLDAKADLVTVMAPAAICIIPCREEKWANI